MNPFASLSILTLALGMCGPAAAQVAGSTAVENSVTGAQDVAAGWSVRKSILGRVVYNESNQKIGIVRDLVIAPDRSVSYLIIGAGGFVGMGRHDVAVPVTQIDERVGKIVMPGGTRDAIKSMPEFEYAFTSFKRDEFVANAEWDISKAKDRISDLQSDAATATDEARVALHHQIVGIQQDLSDAQDALGDMKRAEARRWKEFEKKVAATTARLRKSTVVASS
jgi:sporulation protein YlmC with PRC-barrel domain